MNYAPSTGAARVYARVLQAVFIALTLSASSTGAESPLKDIERRADDSLARGRHSEAIRLYERALEAGDAGRSDSTRLLAKRGKALRIVDERILAQQRLSHTKGDHARALRLNNFEERDLHAEQLQLVETSSSALISAGESEPVFTFLREYSCRDSACNGMRARLWRALASSSPILEDSELTPDHYWRLAERYDSLAAYAPEAMALKQSRDRARAVASAFHARRAAELAQLAGAAYFHHRMAARYGVPATSAFKTAEREIQALTALDWRVAAAKGSPACPEFARRLGSALPSGRGQPVFVELRLDSCGPGRYSWKEEEEYTYSETVMRATGEEHATTQQITREDGTVVTVSGPTQVVKEPVEALHIGHREVVREADTYFVRGTATLAWGEARRIVELDLHPRFSGKPRPGEMMETVARYASDLLVAAGTKMAAERAHDGVLRASRAEMTGQNDLAEHEYAIAVRLLGTVPAPARDFFARRYGLRGGDVTRCLGGN